VKALSHAAVYPALATHRGTLLRLTLGLVDGSSLVIEPLHFQAGGLVLCSEGFALFGRQTPDDSGIYLLGLDASQIRRIETAKSDVEHVATFVVYPNGFTFSGRILEREQLNDLHALVWTTDLARLVKTDLANEIFRFDADWPDVPSVVGLPSKELLDEIRRPPDLSDIERVASCRFVHHTCPSQCNDRTKRVEREIGGHVV
jgi:hypothetical protein